VALHTLRRRSAKNALQVAPFAHHLRVTATKREAGAAMIEFDIRAVTSLGRSGIRHQQHHATCRQKSGNNGPGKESTSHPASVHIISHANYVGPAHSLAGELMVNHSRPIVLDAGERAELERLQRIPFVPSGLSRLA